MTAMRAAYACLKDNLPQDSQRALRSIQELAFKMTEKSNIVILQAASHATDDIEAGGIQWMTAGSGLVHEEVSSDKFKTLLPLASVLRRKSSSNLSYSESKSFVLFPDVAMPLA